MRIHKALSESGIVSLRRAEDLIRFGQVTVNGHPAFIGQDIDPARDIVCIDGERVHFDLNQKMYYIMLNKPRGYVTTMQDELGRRCVAELVADVPARVYPIGRLDKDSEGLLLLTNDGEFANYIMHPSHHVSKTYRVTVRPYVTEEQLIALSTGVTLDDGYTTAPAQVDVETDEPGRVVLRITIGEGKNRQIRRMCEALGLEVARLRRVSVGPIKLGMLQPGEWRELKPAEVGALRGAVTTPPPHPHRRHRAWQHRRSRRRLPHRPDRRESRNLHRVHREHQRLRHLLRVLPRHLQHRVPRAAACSPICRARSVHPQCPRHRVHRKPLRQAESPHRRRLPQPAAVRRRHRLLPAAVMVRAAAAIPAEAVRAAACPAGDGDLTPLPVMSYYYQIPFVY